MAVIQDLPAETLYRILELGTELPGAKEPEGSKSLDPCTTALVARAWAQPSQEILVYERWSPYLPATPECNGLPLSTRRIRSMVVKAPATAAMARRLVEPHGAQLTYLAVLGVCPTSDLVLLLVNGVEHLTLSGTIQGDFTFPDKTDLTLQSLCLESPTTWPASFLQEVVAHAPHLTRLELEGAFTLPAIYQAPLLALAPQLRHLIIWVPSIQPDHNDLDPYAFLQTCTSLVSLDLLWLQPGHLSTLLSSIPSTLAVLTCSFNEDDSIDESVSSDLHGALKQPALSNLKRWRWVERYRQARLREVSYSLSTERSWEAACRARGIEPRGKERYFTD